MHEPDGLWVFRSVWAWVTCCLPYRDVLGHLVTPGSCLEAAAEACRITRNCSLTCQGGFGQASWLLGFDMPLNQFIACCSRGKAAPDTEGRTVVCMLSRV